MERTWKFITDTGKVYTGEDYAPQKNEKTPQQVGFPPEIYESPSQQSQEPYARRS